jgi:hypothetical protein
MTEEVWEDDKLNGLVDVDARGSDAGNVVLQVTERRISFGGCNGCLTVHFRGSGERYVSRGVLGTVVNPSSEELGLLGDDDVFLAEVVLAGVQIGVALTDEIGRKPPCAC